MTPVTRGRLEIVLEQWLHAAYMVDVLRCEYLRARRAGKHGTCRTIALAGKAQAARAQGYQDLYYFSRGYWGEEVQQAWELEAEQERRDQDHDYMRAMGF